MTIDLNNVQAESIEVTGNITASLNKYYIQTASSTFTDPSPTAGKGYVVFVRTGTATIGATPYTAGSYVLRYYSGGAWSSVDLASGGGALPDGNYGDVTVSGSGTVISINASTIGITELSATGSPSATTYLRGDNTWATISSGGLTQQQVEGLI